MKDLLRRLEELKQIGNPTLRAAAAYDLGSKVRNFAGELAFKLADKGDPYGELAKTFPDVKRKGKKATDAMIAFSKAVFDTERFIDITPQVRGRLREELTEALTAKGVGATLDRVVDKAKTLAPRLNKTVMAGEFKKILSDASDELEKIASGIREGNEEPPIPELLEKSQPRLNKYDPGSLLGWVVYLLEKEGLEDAVDEVKRVSKTVSRAWQERER